ncbi:MAG: hypothetical protein FJ137_05085 [Deltaproteobacteria bacterium]|nr:hypothetical protein [Deltaproteobacteria bacterium]
MGVDNGGDDDDDLRMTRVSLDVIVVLFALLGGAPTLAHEGHAATPVHVHVEVPGQGGADRLAVDVGAAIVALLVGAALLGAARRRA